MKYWWVNQNQTYKHEILGGFMWSPKENKNGAVNQFYTNMTHVNPGDIVFSFSNQKISDYGVVESKARDESKPTSFGSAGSNWAKTGWMVDVSWIKVKKPIWPKAIIGELLPHLPSKYSPIQKNGNGNQVYLAEITDEMAQVLFKHLNIVLSDLPGAVENGDFLKDLSTIEQIFDDAHIEETEKRNLAKARVGQGKFRIRLESIEKSCRITGISDPRFLVASHIKPWAHCDNADRLNGNNGLLLSPNIDHLFDRGYISFENNGDLLISDHIDTETIKKLGLLATEVNVGNFNEQQQKFLSYHRSEIFVR